MLNRSYVPPPQFPPKVPNCGGGTRRAELKFADFPLLKALNCPVGNILGVAEVVSVRFTTANK